MSSSADETESIVRAGAAGPAVPAPQLIRLIECDQPLAPSSRHLLAGVEVVDVGRGRRFDVERGVAGGMRRLRLEVADRAMSSTHARLVKLRGRWLVEDQGSKNSSLVNGAPVERALLADGDLIELGGTFFLYRDAVPPLEAAEDVTGAALAAPAGLGTFVASLAGEVAALARVAPSTLPVVVLGETGTGKEVVARALHALSRRPGPFIAVNCGALVPTLVEAELFGHRRGAFSGALDDRPGHVRSADRGTLFLDEIGDLPAAAQAVLLRVLQEREVVPIGESQPVKVDVRLLAATHRDLAGSLRQDLLARLSGLTVHLPPLRQRREDLGLLIAALLARIGGSAPRFAPAALRALLRHEWPQNVRELEMALRAAVLLAAGAPVDLPHLPAALRVGVSTTGGVAAPLSSEEAEVRDKLVASLTEHAGNVAAVARALGKGRMQIHRWLRRFGLDLRDYRGG